MCSSFYSSEDETKEVAKEYAKLDASDRRMVRELILRLQRKARGLVKKVVYVEDCG
jgi:hypothetical protein